MKNAFIRFHFYLAVKNICSRFYKYLIKLRWQSILYSIAAASCFIAAIIKTLDLELFSAVMLFITALYVSMVFHFDNLTNRIQLLEDKINTRCKGK